VPTEEPTEEPTERSAHANGERGAQGRAAALSVGLALSAAAGVIVLTSIWGRRVEKRNPDIKLGAPPLVGKMNWRPTAAVLPAVAIAVLVVFFGPRLSARVRTRSLAPLSALTGMAFTFALAVSDGFSRVLEPVVNPTEYWANLTLLPTAGRMLGRFSDRHFLRNFSVHLKGHPPGFILLLKGLAAIGLDHPWVAGALSYVGVALMISGLLTTTRLVVNDDTARRCAPFVVLTPFAMWLGTSADAFYAGVAAAGVALVALALARTGPRAYVLAATAGLTLGGLLFLTYAAATFLLIPSMIALAAYRTPWQRRIPLGLTAVTGMAAVILVFRGFGFWWVAGLKNTNWFYWHGTAQFRPWRFFLVSNLGAFFYAIGPAVLAGLVSLRRTRVWVLAGGALLCVTFATASQYSKGEVERIWVLFYPWMIPAVAVLPARRLWLAAQSALIIVLQLWLVSKW
jgi:methylthioxylose transferase